jgi:hypothetical protein
MRRAAALAALLAMPAGAHARGSISGDGTPTTQRRDVGEFDRIELATHADVNVRVGGERSVAVTIDGNLQRHLRTEVRGGTLVIDSDPSLRTRTDARVDVTVPALRGFAIEGAGDVAIEGGSGPVELAIEGSGDLRWKGEATALRASIEGSGDLRLDGRAERLEVAVEGSGRVEAAGLRAKDVSASVEGSGDVDVTVDGGSLAASVSGSGDIRWRGQAKVESVSVSGSGEISRRD